MSLFVVLINRQIALFHKHKPGIMYFSSVIGFFLYLAIGAVLFMVVEGEEYENAQKAVMDAKDIILRKYPTMPAEALDEFVDELRIVGIRGLPKKNGTISKWRFSDSWFFVVTLVTTVGYGHFTPRTLLGKLVCVVYTAIGIPLTLIHMAIYVDKLMKMSENYKALIFRQYQGRIGPLYIRFLHVSTLMTFIVFLCFVLPGFYFSCMEENWSLLDGIYFCFISLTTVGLGDLVPSMNPNMLHSDIYVISASFFLLIGIIIIMFMMAMCSDYSRNFNNGYEQLPFTIPTEKFPINPGTIHTYGSILTNSGKSEAVEKAIVKYDKLNP